MDKVIVITGASSGLGKGAALRFAAEGARLVLAARRADALEATARECGAEALTVPTDVSQADEVQSLARAALERFGRIDVWVNDAAGSVVGRFDEVPLAEHAQVIRTNLLGTVFGSYAALRQFHAQESGGILINIASMLGKIPAPYMASYVASKHGVVGLSAALRQELEVGKIEKIRVCTVMPASTDTTYFEHGANHTGHETVPIPPTYDADDVIKVIVDLATDPRDEVAVGIVGGKGGLLAYRLAPGLVESFMAKHTHHQQLEKAEPAPETDGNLVTTSPEGTSVSGGIKDKEKAS